MTIKFLDKVIIINSKDLEGSGSSIQLETLPTASSSLVGKIVQYVGATNDNYTNGYFYKCVSTLTNTPSTEHVTVTQTAGLDMGDFTVNINQYKQEMTNYTQLKSFSFVGNPSKVEAWNMNTFSSITLERESAVDTRISYGWINDTNDWYWTNTPKPDITTEFYSDSSLSTGTGYTYLSTTTRYTSGFSGMWTFTGEETEVDINDFGIGNDAAPTVGVIITTQYVPTVLAEYAYSWNAIDVQGSNDE